MTAREGLTSKGCARAAYETLRKITTEEHAQSLQILRPITEKGQEAQGGSQPSVSERNRRN